MVARLPHPEPISGASYSAVELALDNASVWLLDQRKLPDSEEYIELRTVGEMARAISDMVVRGAPAIGIAAAYAMVLAAREPCADYAAHMRATAERLVKVRPTAVNLHWAAAQCVAVAEATAPRSPGERVETMADLARRLHREDVAANRRLGELGAERVLDGATVLTHCNAGALATGGFGTALGVVRAAVAAGKKVRVIADETRPWHQGSRLTTWELMRDGIEVELIADAAAASLFRTGEIDLVVVGADRVAANGDVANKIGTYGVACLARHHERPFYVAAPLSTLDLTCASGDAIEIEMRDVAELVRPYGKALAPAGVSAKNPVFDVTPAKLISALFTERGVVEPMHHDGLVRLADAAPFTRVTS